VSFNSLVKAVLAGFVVPCRKLSAVFILVF